MDAKSNTSWQMTPPKSNQQPHSKPEKVTTCTPPKSNQQPHSKPEKHQLPPVSDETTTTTPLGIRKEPNGGGGGGGGGGFSVIEIESQAPAGAAQVGKPFYIHMAKAAQPVALCLVASAGTLHFSYPTGRDAPAYVEIADRLFTLTTFLLGAGLSIYSVNNPPSEKTAFYQKYLVSFGFLSALLPFVLRLWFL